MKKKAKKIKKVREVTNENLAIMIGKEFLIVGKRFKNMDSRFNKLDKDLGSIREEIVCLRADTDEIKNQLGSMAYRFEIQGIERRLKRAEIKLGIKN